MTTDKSEAPERIHLGTRPTRYNYGFCYIDADLPLTTEYVRTDIYAAMQTRAEKAELREQALLDNNAEARAFLRERDSLRAENERLLTELHSLRADIWRNGVEKVRARRVAVTNEKDKT